MGVRRGEGSNTPHSVLGVICLRVAPGGRGHCLPNAIASTSACLRGSVAARRPGVLLPAFTHHLARSRPRVSLRLVSSLLRLASRRPFARRGPPCCFGGLVYPEPHGPGGCGEVPLARGPRGRWPAPATPGALPAPGAHLLRQFGKPTDRETERLETAGAARAWSTWCRRGDLNSHGLLPTTP